MIDLTDKKVAVFGGSFNPIHNGHLLSGLEILEKLKYDYIVFIPANIPVHKNFDDAALSQDRIKMVELATEKVDHFLYSDIEIKRGGFSYTIDTVDELKKKFKINNKIGIIIGDDLLESLSSWKKIDQIQQMCDILCLTRNENCYYNDQQYSVKFVKNRIIQISSTEIRHRIRECKSIEYMLPEKVVRYIEDNKIYRI